MERNDQTDDENYNEDSSGDMQQEQHDNDGQGEDGQDGGQDGQSGDDEQQGNNGNGNNNSAQQQNQQQHQQQLDRSSATNLIINYLPQDMSDRELFNLFSGCGPINTCKIMRDFKVSACDPPDSAIQRFWVKCVYTSEHARALSPRKVVSMRQWCLSPGYQVHALHVTGAIPVAHTYSKVGGGRKALRLS